MITGVKKPELLAPAGDLESVRAALHFGADAVYCGGPRLQMRSAKAGFDPDSLAAAASLCRAKGKKLYVTVNTFVYDDEIRTLPDYASKLRDAGADALIVSDLGAISLLRRERPDIPIHVSTQANCTNSEAAAVYAAMGVSRIVPARELSVERIAELRRGLPESTELELFVHGAMCMAYSGRCLISSFLNSRSGNRGECTQPCRWNYYLCEEKRPGQYLPVVEEDGMSAILSSHDLCCVDILDELTAAGAASFKIEGRMKTAYYVATTVNAYRRAIDGKNDVAYCREELDKASHRPYSHGFYHGAEQRDHNNAGTYSYTRQFAAVVTEKPGDGVVVVRMRNRFRTGDKLEVLSPSIDCVDLTVPVMRASDGSEVTDALLPDQLLELKTDLPLEVGDMLRNKISSESLIAS